MRSDLPSAARREISILSDYYNLFPEKWGRLHLSLLYHYLDNGSLDTALSVSEEMMSVYKKKEYFVAAAQTAQGHIYLHRGKKEKANELFDRCITAHLNTDGVWEAWMALADIYKYDFRYNDALTIYQKIFRESTPSIAVHWMAAVEAADLIGREDAPRRDSLLGVVISEPHPFPVPRMIARLYLGILPENRFKELWERFFPGDRSYLIYLARKAMINKEQIVAGLYLNDFKRQLVKRHWDYFKTLKILHNLENW
jgi:tetratricopeptide (TPR) repeat protein